MGSTVRAGVDSSPTRRRRRRQRADIPREAGPWGAVEGRGARSAVRHQEPDLREGEAVLAGGRTARAAERDRLPVADHRPGARRAAAPGAADGLGRPHPGAGPAVAAEAAFVAGVPGLGGGGERGGAGRGWCGQGGEQGGQEGLARFRRRCRCTARGVRCGGVGGGRGGGFGWACQGRRARATAAKRAAAGGLTAPASRWCRVVRRIRWRRRSRATANRLSVGACRAGRGAVRRARTAVAASVSGAVGRHRPPARRCRARSASRVRARVISGRACGAVVSASYGLGMVLSRGRDSGRSSPGGAGRRGRRGRRGGRSAGGGRVRRRRPV